MIRAKKLERGDTVGVVSLSSGVLGEEFVKHEVKLFTERLEKEFGLKIKYMENSRKGIEYLREHPEARAEDLKQAFLDPEVKIIWSAIGGDDAIRLEEYVVNEEFKKIVEENPKIFMGFSDTTNVHLMLYKLGLRTFYGPALLPDVAELGPEMLEYTKEWIDKLFINPDTIRIETSPVWYRARTKFDESQVGVKAEEVKEERGMVFLGEEKKVKGEVLGGCLDSLAAAIEKKSKIFPERKDWAGKILFIESSDGQPEPEVYKKMIQALEGQGVFEEVVGVLAGKPMDEKYFSEYQEELERIGKEYRLPIVYNLNFGHATPRMILGYGVKVEINAKEKSVSVREKMLED